MKIESLFSKFLHSLKGEDTNDAFRNTLAVVLPIIVFFYMGWPNTGIGIGVGTMIICMTDLPGNRTDKVNTAWVSILLFTLVAILTSWSTHYTLLMIGLMVLLTFVLSMFGVMGNRMFVTGSLGIAVATFTIGLRPENSLLYGSYIFYGCVWYYAISLLQIYLFPYRSLRRAIVETERSTASLLSLRSTGYNPSISLVGFNDKNIRLHLKLANQHELLRQLLLTDARTMHAKNKKGSIFLAKALNLIDLYEQVSAVHYDYPYLRKVLSSTGTLLLIEEAGALLANQLTATNSENFSRSFFAVLNKIQVKTDTSTIEQRHLLQQIVINLVEIHDLLAAIQDGYILESTQSDSKRYQEFLTLSPLRSKEIRREFSLTSPVLRFALRLSALSLVALVLITLFAKEHYSYWILLTMIVVSRPSFGLTLKRNGQRLLGTGLGIALGWSIAKFTTVPFQLVASGVFLFGFFAFNRLQYALSVVCITVAVILCLNAYEGGLWDLVTGRILFTLLGLLMCLAAAFLFPIWNAPRIKDLVAAVIKANVSYFKSVVNLQPHNVDKIHQTRLARKYSHQQLAGLSEAILAAQREPFHKKFNWSLIKRVQLLNYQLNVLTAAFAAMQKTGRNYFSADEIERVSVYLKECEHLEANLNLFSNDPLPSWGNQRMNLLDVSANLAMLLKTNVSEVSTSHD